MIFASVHGRMATEPKQRETSNGKPMATGFMLVDLPVHDDDPMTLPLGVLAFGDAALELARIGKGDMLTVAGEIRGSRYTKDGEAVERMQIVATSIIGPRTARSTPRNRSTTTEPRGAE